MSETARVVMYGRPGCHLCEQAAEVIARVCDDLGETWVEVSIDDYEALREEYGEEIPVCTEQTEDCWAQNRRARFVVASGQPTS